MTSLPPIFSSQRFRTALIALSTLVVCVFTFAATSPESHPARAVVAWAPSPWSGTRPSSSALSWTEPSPDSIEGWKNGSLAEWLQSPEIDSPVYDIEESYEPPTGAFTAGVVWLTRRKKIRDTLASLESLARFMPMEQDYAFIFMHSGDLADDVTQNMVLDRWTARSEQLATSEPSLAAKMRRMAGGIEFLEIDMGAPEAMSRKGREGLGRSVVFANVWPGYHSMCRFYAVNIFWNHRMRKLDYYMRMDTDSYILTPMQEDPFRRMQAAGTSYTYRLLSSDPEYVVKGMADYVEQFVIDNANEPGMEGVQARVENSRIIESSRNELKGGFGGYYNNWEMVHIASFRRPGIQKWLSTLVTNDEAFYKLRWGDAPLRYATVQMFFEPHQYGQFCDFVYYHQFLINQGKLLSTNPNEWKCKG